MSVHSVLSLSFLLSFSFSFFSFSLQKTQTYTCRTFYREASAIKADGLRTIVFRERALRTCREWDPHRSRTPAWASYNGPARDAATRPDYKASNVRDDFPTPTRPPRVRAPARGRSSSRPLLPPSSALGRAAPFPPCGISHARAAHTRSVAAAWEHFRVFPRSPRRSSTSHRCRSNERVGDSIYFSPFVVTRASTRRESSPISGSRNENTPSWKSGIPLLARGRERKSGGEKHTRIDAHSGANWGLEHATRGHGRETAFTMALSSLLRASRSATTITLDWSSDELNDYFLLSSYNSYCYFKITGYLNSYSVKW